MEKRDNCLNYIFNECKLPDCPFGHVIVQSKDKYKERIEKLANFTSELNYQNLVISNVDKKLLTCFNCNRLFAGSNISSGELDGTDESSVNNGINAVDNNFCTKCKLAFTTQINLIVKNSTRIAPFLLDMSTHLKQNETSNEKGNEKVIYNEDYFNREYKITITESK